MHTQKFIEDAISGGLTIKWFDPKGCTAKVNGRNFTLTTKDGLDIDGRMADILIDPTAWAAVGNTRGQIPKDPTGEMRCNIGTCDYKLCEYAGYRDPRRQALSFFEMVLDGLSIEEALGKVST